jgi:hypothetical protein
MEVYGTFHIWRGLPISYEALVHSLIGRLPPKFRPQAFVIHGEFDEIVSKASLLVKKMSSGEKSTEELESILAVQRMKLSSMGRNLP